MPSTSFEPLAGISVRVRLWFYRVGAFLLLNVIDEPAWLALMFC
ncbi:MAG: hypothetical protein ACOYNZ_11305 [Rhodoferax sp.]